MGDSQDLFVLNAWQRQRLTGKINIVTRGVCRQHAILKSRNAGNISECPANAGLA